MGDLLDRPDPTVALDLIAKVLDYLVTDCSWPPRNIHLFGFSQGGSVALESCLKWWKAQLVKAPTGNVDPTLHHQRVPLGSVVTIGGPLLSHPTLSAICSTPLFVFNRNTGRDSALSRGDFASFMKGFSSITEVNFPGEAMPMSRTEWRPIMEFWSQRLRKRSVEGLYEIISG